MKVIVLNDYAFIEGGASKVALSSARALAERGNSVLCFAATGPISPDLQRVPGLEIQCLQQPDITHAGKLSAARDGIWNYTAAHAFAQVLRSCSPEDTVVHLHTWTKASSASVIREAWKRGFRTVLTLHDYFSVCPNGGFFQYPVQQNCHLRPMSGSCIRTQCDSRSYSYKLWRVARQWTQSHLGGIPENISCFLSVSDQSELLIRPYLPPDKPVYRVPNPIDVQQETMGDPAASGRFCFVGRLAPEKGSLLLAAAAAAGRFDVTVVGLGPEQGRFASMVPWASFPGWLETSDVVKIMRGSRALIFPSLWYETQGMTVAEAAALGIPSIVSSETAAREWIEDGVTGLLFRRGDSEDLRRKMQLLHDQPALASDMGRRAYERYWRRPATMENHCQALEEIYRNLLRSSGDSTHAEAMPLTAI